jgi:transposase
MNLYAQARPEHRALSTSPTFNHKESPMTTPAHLGTDIAKHAFDAVLFQDGRARHRHFTSGTAGFTQLHAWLRADAPLQAGLEATSRYGDALALVLHQSGVRVSVINPSRTHAFAKSELTRAKTDRADAALIARFLAAHQPPSWAPPLPEQRQLQATVRRLEALRAMRQQERNRLNLEEASGVLRESLDAHLQHLEEQIELLRQGLRAHLRPPPAAALQLAAEHPRHRGMHRTKTAG